MMEKIDYATEINRLRKEKNAFILAHYYQTGEIQDIADKVGDSLALAQWAAKTTADIIVLCGQGQSSALNRKNQLIMELLSLCEYASEPLLERILGVLEKNKEVCIQGMK